MVLELTAHLPVTWSEVQVLEVIIQAHSLQVIHFLLNLHTSGTKMKDGRFWLSLLWGREMRGTKWFPWYKLRARPFDAVLVGRMMRCWVNHLARSLASYYGTRYTESVYLLMHLLMVLLVKLQLQSYDKVASHYRNVKLALRQFCFSLDLALKKYSKWVMLKTSDTCAHNVTLYVTKYPENVRATHVFFLQK